MVQHTRDSIAVGYHSDRNVVEMIWLAGTDGFCFLKRQTVVSDESFYSPAARVAFQPMDEELLWRECV